MKPSRSLPLVAAAALAAALPLLAQDVSEDPALGVPTPEPATGVPTPALPASEPALSADLKVPEWRLAYENLDPAKQQLYNQHLFEATRLFNQKRVIEALNEVSEAEKIFDKGPAALNLRGACYVEFRDFQRARAIFEEAYELQKVYMEGIEGVIGESRRIRMRPVVNILFNIAEMDFVMKNYQECHDRLTQLLPVMDEKAVAMSRLMEFKLLLCNLKLDKVAEARQLAAKYDYLDDNPFYYYAQSAIAYFDKNTEEAERWRASARKVFLRPEVLAPWEDTMIEFGYVKSFYGGDLEEGE